MRWSILLVTLAMLSAGCMGAFDGDDGEPEEPDNETGDNRTNETNETNETNRTNETNETNETNDTEEPSNATGEEGAEWTYDNRSGTVSSVDPILLTGGEEEAFTVENGTFRLELNLSADGELDVCIKEPGAEECTEETTVEEGNISWNTSDPAAGEWVVELSHGGLLSSVDYELVIAMLVPSNATEGEEGNNTTLALNAGLPSSLRGTCNGDRLEKPATRLMACPADR